MFDNSSIYPNRLPKHDLLWGDKNSGKTFCAKKGEKYKKKTKKKLFFLQKTVKIWKKKCIFLQFAFNNQNFARTKEHILSLCAGGLLETLYPKDLNKYLPQDCINSPLLEKPFAENTVVTSNVSEKVPQVLWC